MDENTINDIEQETINEQNENVNTSTDTSVEVEESTTDVSTLDDNIALAYDYYDRYYEQVLENMDTMISNEQLIIENKQDIIEQNEQLLGFSSCILFTICVFLIYYTLRKMIIVK